VTEPLTTAPSESNFDDIAKLFTSAMPAPAPASEPVTERAPLLSDDSLNLIHEGEDLLGSPDQHRSVSNESIIGRASTVADSAPTAASTNASDAPPKSFDLPFLAGLTSAEQAVPPASERAPETPGHVAAPVPSSAFVTETMAELYIKQGHLDQARDVYRQLVQLHPSDAALAARLRELVARGSAQVSQQTKPAPVTPEVVAEAGPTIREFLGSIAEFRLRTGEGAPHAANGNASAVETVRNDSASSGNRESVAGSLNTLFAEAEHRTAPAGPPADLGYGLGPSAASAESAEPLGRPSTPAATELSLDHVFRHATPASSSGAHSSFSFDQFFSQQAQHDVAASEPESSAGESAGLSDDIQQFNAWLEGLKKS
jgi:hypothetical protein